MTGAQCLPPYPGYAAPGEPRNDPGNDGSAYPNIVSDVGLHFTGANAIKNVEHQTVSQDRVTIPRSRLRPPAATLNGFVNVVGRRPRMQVPGIDAWRVVAIVQHIQIIGQGTTHQAPGKARGFDALSGRAVLSRYPEIAIAGGNMAHPWPTCISATRHVGQFPKAREDVGSPSTTATCAAEATEPLDAAGDQANLSSALPTGLTYDRVTTHLGTSSSRCHASGSLRLRRGILLPTDSTNLLQRWGGRLNNGGARGSVRHTHAVRCHVSPVLVENV